MGFLDDLMQAAHQAVEQGNLKVAADGFAQVIYLDPTNAEAWYQAGLVLYQTGHTDQSLASIEHAITLDTRVEYLVNLGQIYRGEREFGRAEALLEIALDCDNENPEAWFQLGCVQREQGRLSEALASLEEVTRFAFPRDVTFTEIGKVYEANGQIPQAISAYEHALTINPSSTTSLERLSSLSIAGEYNLNPTQLSNIGHLSTTFADFPTHAERSAKLVLAEEISFAAAGI